MASLCTCLGAVPCPGEEPPPGGPPTNLEVIAALAREAGDSVRMMLGGWGARSVGLRVLPEADSWMVASAFWTGLEAGAGPGNDSSDLLAEFAVRALPVAYGGGDPMERRVELAAGVMVRERVSGRTLLLRDFHLVRRDTVGVRELEGIENAAVPASRGRRPEEGLLSGFVEPLLLMGAIGVAVFLLFRVRS
ncbi:MAG: hypothetical protein WB626_07600 [Bacteroidota bacterium]